MSGVHLGIDLGTSAVKALLVDADERVVASAEARLSVSRPHPGWSEQAPDDWVAAAFAAIDALAADAPAGLAAVEGVGLSGQMHGATLLGADDRPLRPAILWNDGRSTAECAALDARAPFREIGGNLVMPGFTAPKLEWVRVHEPEIHAAIRMVLLPKDYLRLALTGERVSEMSDAAGTLWLNVAARDWSERLLEATGLDRARMPRLVEGSQASGRLRSELAARWGMAVAPVVAGGGGDNAATACGVGAVRPGDAFLSLGTSGVLFVSGAGFAPNTAKAVHAFCHALPDTWHRMGVMLAAADALEWLAELCDRPAAALAAEAEAADAAGETAGSVRFLPYLSGERTPLNDAEARGAFVGLARADGRAALTRAVMEGVAFGLRDTLEALAEAGDRPKAATVVGGGARSALWLRILADTLGISLELPEDGPFGAALGAARLGRLAATGEDPLSVCRPPRMARRIDPDPMRSAAVTEAHAAWSALYPATRGFR